MAAGGSETILAVTEVSKKLTKPTSQPRDVMAAPFPQECGWTPFSTWRVAQGHPWA